MASAGFCCSPEERNSAKNEVKKALGAASMEPNSDFSAYTPKGSKAIFVNPPFSHSTPKLHPTGDTMTLAGRNEITPEEAMDSCRKPSESIPKSDHIVLVPMSPATVERNNRSPIIDTENIPISGSNSVLIETRSKSPVPTVSMTSHISNPQVNEGNDKSNEPISPKMPSCQRPSTELNNSGLSAGKANLIPYRHIPTYFNY